MSEEKNITASVATHDFPWQGKQILRGQYLAASEANVLQLRAGVAELADDNVVIHTVGIRALKTFAEDGRADPYLHKGDKLPALDGSDDDNAAPSSVAEDAPLVADNGKLYKSLPNMEITYYNEKKEVCDWPPGGFLTSSKSIAANAKRQNIPCLLVEAVDLQSYVKSGSVVLVPASPFEN